MPYFAQTTMLFYTDTYQLYRTHYNIIGKIALINKTEFILFKYFKNIVCKRYAFHAVNCEYCLEH